MKKKLWISLLVLALLLAFAAGVAAGGVYELYLGDGEEAFVYCAGGALHTEAIDDLTFYHRCGDEPADVYFPVWSKD